MCYLVPACNISTRFIYLTRFHAYHDATRVYSNTLILVFFFFILNEFNVNSMGSIGSGWCHRDLAVRRYGCHVEPTDTAAHTRLSDVSRILLGSQRPRDIIWARDKFASAPLPATVITLAAMCFYRLLNWGKLSAQNQTQLMMPLSQHTRGKKKKKKNIIMTFSRKLPLVVM